MAIKRTSEDQKTTAEHIQAVEWKVDKRTLKLTPGSGSWRAVTADRRGSVRGEASATQVEEGEDALVNFFLSLITFKDGAVKMAF